MHGVSPTLLKKGDVTVDVLSKPSFEFRRTGLENIPIKIMQTDDMHILGFCGISVVIKPYHAYNPGTVEHFAFPDVINLLHHRKEPHYRLMIRK